MSILFLAVGYWLKELEMKREGKAMIGELTVGHLGVVAPISIDTKLFAME